MKRARHVGVSLGLFPIQELQRAQEVQDVLLLAGGEVLIEDGFDRSGFPAIALMSFDGAKQVFAPAIVEEEDSLSKTPQRGRAELIAAGAALGHVVGQHVAHMMDFQITEQVGRSASQARGEVRSVGLKRWSVAQRAADGAEQRTPVGNRGGST